MPDPLDDHPFAPTPSAERPLLGLTVLVVEDSRYASEAMRLLCLRSGARIRRADSLKSARRHLAVYRPSVLIVDLGLPDGSGTELIVEAATTTPRVGVILGISGDPATEAASIQAGADGFLVKPIDTLSAFQSKILAHLPQDRQPRQPRLVNNDVIVPDPLALKEDLTHIAELLGTSGQDERIVSYVARFLEGVGRIAHDQPLSQAAETLMREQESGRKVANSLGKIRELLGDRLNEHKKAV